MSFSSIRFLLLSSPSPLSSSHHRRSSPGAHRAVCHRRAVEDTNDGPRHHAAVLEAEVLDLASPLDQRRGPLHHQVTRRRDAHGLPTLLPAR